MSWKEVDKQISHHVGSSGVFSPPKDNPQVKGGGA